MKTILFCLLFVSSTVFANSEPMKTLVCGEGFMRFEADLDSSGFAPGHGLYHVDRATVIYNYSGAQLICAGRKVDQLTCIGFWNGSGGDQAKVVTSKDQEGTLFATFTTSKLYGHRTVTFPCEIK